MQRFKEAQFLNPNQWIKILEEAQKLIEIQPLKVEIDD